MQPFSYPSKKNVKTPATQFLTKKAPKIKSKLNFGQILKKPQIEQNASHIFFK
jgi:hypothetical protein